MKRKINSLDSDILHITKKQKLDQVDQLLDLDSKLTNIATHEKRLPLFRLVHSLPKNDRSTFIQACEKEWLTFSTLATLSTKIAPIIYPYMVHYVKHMAPQHQNPYLVAYGVAKQVKEDPTMEPLLYFLEDNVEDCCFGSWLYAIKKDNVVSTNADHIESVKIYQDHQDGQYQFFMDMGGADLSDITLNEYTKRYLTKVLCGCEYDTSKRILDHSLTTDFISSVLFPSTMNDFISEESIKKLVTTIEFLKLEKECKKYDTLKNYKQPIAPIVLDESPFETLKRQEGRMTLYTLSELLSEKERNIWGYQCEQIWKKMVSNYDETTKQATLEKLSSYVTEKEYPYLTHFISSISKYIGGWWIRGKCKYINPSKRAEKLVKKLDEKDSKTQELFDNMTSPVEDEDGYEQCMYALHMDEVQTLNPKIQSEINDYTKHRDEMGYRRYHCFKGVKNIDLKDLELSDSEKLAYIKRELWEPKCTEQEAQFIYDQFKPIDDLDVMTREKMKAVLTTYRSK